MHEVQIEVDFGSAASAKAVLKSGIVVAVIAFGKRREIWFCAITLSPFWYFKSRLAPTQKGISSSVISAELA
jgi:hypothetical protein